MRSRPRATVPWPCRITTGWRRSSSATGAGSATVGRMLGNHRHPAQTILFFEAQGYELAPVTAIGDDLRRMDVDHRSGIRGLVYGQVQRGFARRVPARIHGLSPGVDFDDIVCAQKTQRGVLTGNQVTAPAETATEVAAPSADQMALEQPLAPSDDLGRATLSNVLPWNRSVRSLRTNGSVAECRPPSSSVRNPAVRQTVVSMIRPAAVHRGWLVSALWRGRV